MRTACFTLTTLLVVACRDSSVVHREGEPEVMNFESDDAEMNAAIAAARASFAGFAAQLPRLRESHATYSVKVPVRVGAVTEHIWLDSPVVIDGEVRGQLANVPLGDSHKLGDDVSVPIDAISDWMAIVDGELFGGYTLRVARSRMSADEQREFDRSSGVSVPAAVRTF